MIEMQGFVEKFIQREEEKCADWLLQVFGTGSELLFPAAEMH